MRDRAASGFRRRMRVTAIATAFALAGLPVVAKKAPALENRATRVRVYVGPIAK